MFSNPDRSENNAAQDAELNPLSNPLLAANLGRWAEVYFTTPPERRAQAVAGLLRELEIEAQANSAVPLGEAATLNARSQQAHTPLEAARPLTAPSHIACAACGHNNLQGQSFCVMCGLPLTSPPEEHNNDVSQSALLPYHQTQPMGSYFIDEKSESHRSFDTGAGEHEGVWAPLPVNLEYGDLPSFARQSETVPYRYRLYVGVVLAILLAGLIYLAKRGDVFSDGQQSPDAKVIPAAQPTPNAQAAQNNAQSPQSASSAPSPVERVENNENSQPPKPQAEPPPAAIAPSERSPSRPAPRSTSTAANTAAASLQPGQSGAENLAQAQRYLNGNQSGIRNTGEAVALLWDAVAKGNAPATLVLSDLYLRGDGVPQNCDQARLLLDLAAKKGMKGAGERLRHLQAFGCR